MPTSMNIPPPAVPDLLHLVITPAPRRLHGPSVGRRWTPWNHVRVIASPGAAGLLAVALLLG